MENRGNTKWAEDTEVYAEEQIKAVINSIGLDLESETMNDFLAFCPFHGNRDTPSFSVSKTKGSFICYNPSCMEMGKLHDLIMRVGKKNYFEASRLIYNCSSAVVQQSFEERYKKATEEKVEFVPWEQEKIDQLHAAFMGNKRAKLYMMEERHFTEKTLVHFSIGYSKKKDMIAVPAHTPEGIPIGVIGREISQKEFKNSAGLHTSRFLFNLNRARRESDVVILCESSFDAMRIHQAGYPNVIACLGGNFSIQHFALLERNFSRVVIMTDFDDKNKHKKRYCMSCTKAGFNECQGHNPGRDLGQKVVNGLKSATSIWASYDYGVVYPHGAKDAGDMTDAEIAQCIKNAVSNVEYQSWHLY